MHSEAVKPRQMWEAKRWLEGVAAQSHCKVRPLRSSGVTESPSRHVTGTVYGSRNRLCKEKAPLSLGAKKFDEI